MQRCAVTAACLATTLACSRAPESTDIVASGQVEATEVRVSTKVAGTIEAFPVEQGQPVAAGQELARIDTTDVRLAVDAARAERAQAQAELSLRRAGSRREDVAEARAQVDRAHVDLQGAERDLERMEGLLASGSGTAKARDDARTRRDLAAAALRAAQERLGKLQAGSRPQEIEAARARVAATDARIAQLEQQLKDAVITSPVAGVLTERLAEAGELASRGSALAVVTELKGAWLTAYVGAPDLPRIRLGQEAKVVTDDGQTRSGRVTFIASKAEFTPKNVQTRDERAKLVYQVRIALDNRDGLFKPGMPAQARLAPAGSAQ